MSTSHLWGAVLWCISLSGWSMYHSSVTDKPRLPGEKSYTTMAMSVIVLYIFPAVGTLLLTDIW